LPEIRIMTPKPLREIPAVFYRAAGGTEPVLDWLRSLPPEDRRAIGTDLATVQFGWPIGMPLCRALGGGLWEVRSTLPSRRIARVVFFVDGGRIGVLHGFIKKTQKTPAGDLELARKRMQEMKT
jgi:phage-related protein